MTDREAGCLALVGLVRRHVNNVPRQGGGGAIHTPWNVLPTAAVFSEATPSTISDIR